MSCNIVAGNNIIAQLDCSSPSETSTASLNGTANRLVKYKASGGIDESIISQTGTTEAIVAGDLSVSDGKKLKLKESSANGSEFVSLKSPASLAASTEYTLPTAVPTSNGQVLSSTTAGVMAWEDNPPPLIKYATTQQELTDAFDYFNNLSSGAIGGIVKIGTDITLSSNITLDFGNGIELWGGNNRLKASASNYTVTFVGARYMIKDVIFEGSPKNLDPISGTATDTTNMIKLNSSLTTFVSFQDCTFSNLVGSTLVTAVGYVIDIQNSATDLTISFSGSKITSGSNQSKPYQPFRINYSVATGKDSLRLQIRDWAATGVGPSSSRWQYCKNAMEIRVDGTLKPADKYAFFYDESVTWDSASELAGSANQWLDLFPTFHGPTTRVVSGLNPTSTATFGNPGDIIVGGVATESIYMRHTNIGSQTSNWSKIN